MRRSSRSRALRRDGTAVSLAHAIPPRPRASYEVVGKKIVPVPLLVMGDRLPHRNAVEDDVPAALAWIELVARLGFLRRNENWSKMYERSAWMTAAATACGIRTRDSRCRVARIRGSGRRTRSEPSRAGDERWADACSAHRPHRALERAADRYESRPPGFLPTSGFPPAAPTSRRGG